VHLSRFNKIYLLTYIVWLFVLFHCHVELCREKKSQTLLYLAGNNYLVSEQRLIDDDVEVLCEVLSANTYVTALDLRYNNLTDVGAKHVAQLLSVGTHPIQQCRMNDIPWHNKKLIVLMPILFWQSRWDESPNFSFTSCDSFDHVARYKFVCLDCYYLTMIEDKFPFYWGLGDHSHSSADDHLVLCILLVPVYHFWFIGKPELV